MAQDEQQFKKICSGKEARQPSPILVGGCCVVGESWLVGGKKQDIKLRRKVGENPMVSQEAWMYYTSI